MRPRLTDQVRALRVRRRPVPCFSARFLLRQEPPPR
uniref:Uncharacterized protein n=1 Tax=Arundo donax TaxID=35708 RepID=A0A0A9HCF4_ARUDO